MPPLALRCSFLLIALSLVALPAPALAQADAAVKLGPSGLPLPRFVSLKSGRVNMRVGPGTDYSVEWLYLKPGLPMEVIQEYDNWRRVRDADGAEGWVTRPCFPVSAPELLRHGSRAGEHPSRFSPGRMRARQVAEVEPGVVGNVRTCNGTWCRISLGSHEGWISQDLIWGVYPGETIRE